MGGKVALTVRASETEQWRGSCWTNLLPVGLFDLEFYSDHEASRRHAWGWVQTLLGHRTEDPELEALWGSHGMCAPVDYGIVIVDYVSRSLVSAQSYTSPHRMTLFEFERRAGGAKFSKWRALDAAGLLSNVTEVPDIRMTHADVRIPAFEYVHVGDEDIIDQAMADWAHATLTLSEEEAGVWRAWIDRRQAR